VLMAVDFTGAHPQHKDASIGLLSICMGAASTTYAYGGEDGGLKNYPRIKALIAVQSLQYIDFVNGLGIPAFLNRGASGVN